MEDPNAHKAHQAIYSGSEKQFRVRNYRALLAEAAAKAAAEADEEVIDAVAAGKRLADQIPAVEIRLAQARFRVDCEVWSKDKTYGLGFDRVGDKWCLLYLSRVGDDPNRAGLRVGEGVDSTLKPASEAERAWEQVYLIFNSEHQRNRLARNDKHVDRSPLKDVSLVKKAKAMQLVSDLVHEMKRSHTERLQECRSASNAIEHAMVLLDSLSKEAK